ncbi:isochorismatase family protein [Paenibacillus kobensis]|uniref:isochorismatase family protein n=1 Tax=Paenibacillus kobensis TaxID=59841 RepID=UPI000FDA3769|nr:isochorismatase family protein [Paenibacillus kobensis]
MTNDNTKATDRLDAQKTALVVIDLQKGIAHPGRSFSPHSVDQVIGKASQMVEAFTKQGAFVTLVRVSTTDGKDMLIPITDAEPNPMPFPEGWDVIVPELAGYSNAHIVTKRQWGAFFGTDLDLQLRRRGIDTIVLCGISTSIGVDTTAREAYQHGYNQVFIEEAMTAGTNEEHDYVVQTMFPRMGKIRTAEEVIAALKA